MIAEPILRQGSRGCSRDLTSTTTLSRAARGLDLELVRVEDACGLGARLAEMGLTPGSHFKVQPGGRRFPLIIAFQGVRLVLGRSMAHRIIVRRHSESAR